MKRIISIFTLLLGGSLLLFILGLLGCGRSDRKFVYKDIQSIVLRDSSATLAVQLHDFDTTEYAASFMSLQMDMQVVAKNALQGIGNAAYAWSYDEPSYINLEPVTDIRITPIYDYNSAHAAGSELSQDCIFTYSNSGFGGNDVTKTELISTLNQPMNMDYGTYVGTISIKVKTPPTAAGLQQFAMEIRLGDNSVLRDTTVAYFLKP